MSAMKKCAVSLGLIVVFLAALWVVGPRVEIDTSIQDISLPDDIGQWLVEREAAFPDMVIGSEKRIVWASGTGVRTKQVFVYLHGFSASRQETAPLAETLASELGANLFETRLTGHGRSAEAMTEASVNAWLNDAAEALAIAERLGDEVIVIGVSTGGTLAWWLAAKEPKRVDKLVLISPNFKVRSDAASLLAGPWGEQLAGLLMGQERCFEPQNALQALYWTECYPSKVLAPMMGLLNMVEGVAAGDINQPVLAVYSPNDIVLNAQYTEQRLSQLDTAQLTRFVVEGSNDPKQHVLAGDILSPDTTEIVRTTIIDYLLQEGRPNPL